MSIFANHVGAGDSFGLYTFETGVHQHVKLQEKGPNEKAIINSIRGLPEPEGGSKFFDGVLTCLNDLKQASAEARFLIALTDGDDNMSTTQVRGEKVTKMIHDGIPGLNMIVLSVGKSINQITMGVVETWVHNVASGGNIGMHLNVDNPAGLEKAFEQVGELIMGDDEGEIDEDM